MGGVGGFFLALILVAFVGAIFFMIKRMKNLASLDLEKTPNIFEQGERSVKLSDSEYLVRAYNCMQLKSVFLRTMKARGILTITNKRVIFHTIGVKNDDDFIHHEVSIGKVTAVTVQTGMMANVLSFFAPLAAAFGGKLFGGAKRIFFLDIHAEGVSGEDGAIQVAPTDAKGLNVTLPQYDMIPTEIVIDMANEIGALISDIQLMGEMGAKKWQEEN